MWKGGGAYIGRTESLTSTIVSIFSGLLYSLHSLHTRAGWTYQERLLYNLVEHARQPLIHATTILRYGGIVPLIARATATIQPTRDVDMEAMARVSGEAKNRT